MSPEYLAAWLLPLLAGTGICRVFRCGRCHPAALFGSGWLAGLLLAAWLASGLGHGDPRHAFTAVAPWLLGVAAAAWGGALWRQWRRRGGAVASAQMREAGLMRLLWWLLAALIVLRLGTLAAELALRPVFGWDAWAAWSLRPKTWFLLGQVREFVPMIDWLVSAPAPVRTMQAWKYPELLAWLELWFASAAGAWNEPLIGLAWAGALVAFAASLYGNARDFGVRPVLAMALAYALVSLPLLDAHVVLAGYADLWMAVVLGLAMLAWSRWLLLREPGQWLLALALAACLPAIKLEGAIWFMLFVLVFVLERLPVRWRWGMLGVLGVGVLAGLASGGFTIPVAGLGRVHVAWDRLDIPGVATYLIKWHAVGGSVLAGLFTLPNWHLLWYVLPVFVWWRRRSFRDHRAARALGMLVLLQLSALFVLFFLTSAASWAEDFTSANRLVLQVLPGVFVLAAVVLVPSGGDAIALPDADAASA